ncbi:MAG: DUF3618 domain-containing protein [Roseiflexaceae bacterium]|nr:DUF3618 domain-containing protein [Roseiflexaceae bacterium]
MDKRSDDIRQDIEQTRASLDEKIDMLENKATEVVDQVKTTATDTIDTVKQTFDVKKQVSERPWVALGAALAAGYVLGNLGNDNDGRSSQSTGPTYDYNQHANNGPSTMDTIKSKSQDFFSQFDDEIDMLKVAAMTTLTGFIRDTAREAIPALGPQIERLLKERGLNIGGSADTYSSTESFAGSSSAGYTPKTYSSSVTAGARSGTAMDSSHGSFTASSAPNASMDYETAGGKVNNDAIPQMNRYGMPPPTPSRDDQDFYTTYQPGEDDRVVGGGDKS